MIAPCRPANAPVDRGTERARRILADLGRELRSARRDRGLSQAAIGRAAGVSGVTVGRVERGLAPRVSFLLVARLVEAVGLGLSARAYPGGSPLRDAAHVALLARFRRGLHSSLRWRTEVPLPIVGDQRAWDGLIVGDGWRYGVEAETAPLDAQALGRRLALKARDGGVEGLILLLPRTRRTREFVRDARESLILSFPGSETYTLELLAAGTCPSASTIVRI